MWGVKRWGLLFKSLYIFVKLKPQKFCSLHVFTFSSLQLFGKKCVRNTWYILWVCTTYVWHGASGRGLGPGPGHSAIPVCVQADQAEHSLFWASPSFFGPWVCEYSTGWGQGTGLSWTRIQTQAPLCVLDVAHTRAMTVKVCVHSPKHYLNEDMTTWL